MDAPGGEVDGKVPRLRPAPVQQGGGCVVEGVEGGDVLLVPAHVPQRAAPAHHLRRPVEDHRRILLLLGGRDGEALAQGPQGLGAQPQPAADTVALQPLGLPPGDGGLPEHQGAVVAQYAGEDCAGRHPRQPLAGKAHLQGVGQLHGQGGSGGGEGAEEGVAEPFGLPEGGEHGAHRRGERQRPPPRFRPARPGPFPRAGRRPADRRPAAHVRPDSRRRQKTPPPRRRPVGWSGSWRAAPR